MWKEEKVENQHASKIFVSLRKWSLSLVFFLPQTQYYLASNFGYSWFMENIRIYNFIFSFRSMCVEINTSVTKAEVPIILEPGAI